MLARLWIWRNLYFSDFINLSVILVYYHGCIFILWLVLWCNVVVMCETRNWSSFNHWLAWDLLSYRHISFKLKIASDLFLVLMMKWGKTSLACMKYEYGLQYSKCMAIFRLAWDLLSSCHISRSPYNPKLFSKPLSVFFH